MTAPDLLPAENDPAGADSLPTLLVRTGARLISHRTCKTSLSAPQAGLREPLRPADSRRFTFKSGMTIIEVLVASVILGIGLVGVGSMVTYGTISHQKSANYTIAAARATRELERIREARYAGAVIGTALFPISDYTIISGTKVSFTVSELKNGAGTITLNEDTEATAINPSTGQPYANMKSVSVQITWGGSRTLRGSYRAATLIANRP